MNSVIDEEEIAEALKKITAAVEEKEIADALKEKEIADALKEIIAAKELLGFLIGSKLITHLFSPGDKEKIGHLMITIIGRYYPSFSTSTHLSPLLAEANAWLDNFIKERRETESDPVV